MSLSLEELEEALKELIPNYQIDYDEYGQLIILSGLMLDDEGELVDYEGDEDDSLFSGEMEQLPMNDDNDDKDN
jgi:hypothetical protein